MNLFVLKRKFLYLSNLIFIDLYLNEKILINAILFVLNCIDINYFTIICDDLY